MPIVYDATRPADTYVNGPGRPIVHAWPDDSRVALCGKTRADGPERVMGDKCPACVAAVRMSFIGR